MGPNYCQGCITGDGCYADDAGQCQTFDRHFDVESSVSRQHYVDTGRYLTREDTTGEDAS